MAKQSIVKLIAILIVIAIVFYAAIAISGDLFGVDWELPGNIGADRGIRRGLDLVGGAVIVFQADAESPTPDQLHSAYTVLRRRLDNMGFTEATVDIQPPNQVRVEVPEMTNPAEAAEALGALGLLTFVGGDGQLIMTGAYVENATVRYDFVGAGLHREIHIEFTLSAAGQAAFANATGRLAAPQGQHVPHFQDLFMAMTMTETEVFPEIVAIVNSEFPVMSNSIAIILDGEIVSAPAVSQRLNDSRLIITGQFTRADAQDLADTINAGRLGVPLVQTEMYAVDPSLGQQALPLSILAGLIGLLLIMLFMLIVYRLPGLMASIALLGFVGIMFLVLGFFRVNLNLPGIAGILLSIGMANDANILIFERIKEEMRLGKTVRASVDTGFRRALPAIIDGEFTTLIIACILWVGGTGAIQGFGMALAIGVLVSFFTAVVITRLLLNQMVGLNLKNPKLYAAVSPSKGGDE